MAKTKFVPGSFIVVPSKYLIMEVDAVSQSVFLWLCSYANYERDGYCYPSIKTLANLCHVSRNTVKNRIKKLEKAGLIAKVIRRREDGINLTNLYKILIDDRKPMLGRSKNASYRATAEWIDGHELATN
jgi:DNA-binding MarR family transcriptional regulator